MDRFLEHSLHLENKIILEPQNNNSQWRICFRSIGEYFHEIGHFVFCHGIGILCGHESGN